MNNDLILKRKKAIYKVIGMELFMNLFAFFRDIIYSDYNIVIFKVRRCYALFKVFEKFFEDIPKDKIIISSNAIDACFFDERVKKVLIVDDILIHGRTLYNFREKLRSTVMRDTDIEISVFGKYTVKNDDISKISNTNIQRLLADLKNECQAVNELNEYGWKNLSDKILRCLYSSNTPHVSFVPVFSLHDVSDYSMDKTAVDITSTEQENCGLKAYTVFLDELYSQKIDCKYAVCRVYVTNDELKFVPFYIQPYLCLSSISANDMFSKIIDTCIYGGEMVFRTYTFIMSILIALYYFKLKGIDSFELDETDIYYNFGHTIGKNINIFYNECKECTKEQLVDYMYNLQQTVDYDELATVVPEDINEKLFEEVTHKYSTETMCGQSNHSIDKILSIYFHKSNIIDEQISDIKRKEDISVSSIYKILKVTNHSMSDIISSLISAMDKGVITYRVHSVTSDTPDIVYPCCYAGEQSYHPYSLDYEPVIFALQKLNEVMSNNNHLEKMKKELMDGVSCVFERYGENFDEKYIECFMDDQNPIRYDETSMIMQGLIEPFKGEIFDVLEQILQKR